VPVRAGCVFRKRRVAVIGNKYAVRSLLDMSHPPAVIPASHCSPTGEPPSRGPQTKAATTEGSGISFHLHK
jgi:hypothetical protein